MKMVRSRTGWLSGLLAGVTVLATAPGLAAQSTKMPSTLRYGSGYLDTPSASVIPHLAIMGTFSGFWLDSDVTIETGSAGQVVGVTEGGRDDFMGDGSVTLGLFDRLEIGTTLQSFNDSDQGGNIWGAFGRLAILRPETQGIGLAVGARYVTAPEFDDNVDYMPNRLGFPDRRFTADLSDDADGFLDDEGIDTELTAYAVASAFLRGLESSWLPEHDFTFSLGWGNGMFAEGENQAWYKHADSEGVFGGAALHLGLTDQSLLHIMGEWNGFDVNLGAQFDFGGIRVGGHYLGSNYLEDSGIYRSSKWGVLGSLALCPSGDTFLCKPSLMDRPVPDTVQLPAPPPDTVTVEREVEPPLPTGTPSTICLATGEEAEVLVTAQGDTLVGPRRVSIRTLRPGVVFAGDYAEGRDWFENDEPITYEEREYQKSGNPVRLDCPDIVQIGEHMGVPLFAMRTAEEPYEEIYVPVRPGVFQAYETGLQQTRGQQ